MTAQPQAAVLRLVSAALRRAAPSSSTAAAPRISARPFSAAASGGGLPADMLARIKELRERTGAPLADVKASLASCGWDMDQAVEALRARGLKAAAKKSARHAAEGLVAVALADAGAAAAASSSSSHHQSSAAAVVEINSETDFVARNPDFQALALRAARAVLAHALKQPPAPSSSSSPLFSFSELSPAEAAAAPMPPSSSSSSSDAATPATVGDAVAALAAKVRENLVLRRAFVARTGNPSSARLGAYVHAPSAEGVGRIVALAAVVVGGGGDGGGDTDINIARQVAMHVAGMKPLYARDEDVPEGELERQRARLTEEGALDPSSARKPEAVRAKMVEGRLAKWLDGCVLSRQPFVLDDSVRVSQAVAAAAGKGARVGGFLRVQVGELAAAGEGEGGGGGGAEGAFADEVARLSAGGNK